MLCVMFVIGILAAQAEAGDILPPASKRFADNKSAEVPHLQRHVLPVMGRLGCNGRACHGSFQGQGGFRLSLFGYDFKMDHDALVKGDSPRVDLKHARDSLILTKPTATNEDDHGGGHRLDVDSWQYRIIARWIEAGAPAVDEERDPQFVRLEVSPLEVVYKKAGEKTQLRAICHWSDGTAEDVTPLCRFQSNDEAVAKVDAGGRITVTGPGDTHIVAFYDNGVVPVSVMLPVSDRVGPDYPKVPTPTKIDELVVDKLRKLGIVPSDECTDAEFLRRVSLDMTGTLPTADEVTTFLADNSKNKRSHKVDELLERPAYAAWWATKLCDVLGNAEAQFNNYPFKSAPNRQWYDWMNRRLAENMPYDEIVEGVVLAVGRSSEKQSYKQYCREIGSYVRDKDPVDFTERETMPWYWARRNMKKPNEKALSFSYAFLGVRLQCAECHKHPFDQWSQYDFQHFTAFFNRVAYGVAPGDGPTSRELTEAVGIERNKKIGVGERNKLLQKGLKDGKTIPFEEVYIQAPPKEKSGANKKGDRVAASRVITPKVLGGDEVVDDSYDDPRQPLMDWLRQKDNPYFARAIVNRVWAQYFNVGIVEPPDDMNLANAPSNKELLDWLADAFIEHQYDLKWLHREIAGSRTYQLSWKTNDTNEIDLRNFSHAVPRRLPAEVVIDAVVTATAGERELTERRENPASECSIGFGRGYTNRGAANNNNYALSVFGKPKRETPCDCERSNEPSLLQTVYLRNDSEMFEFIEREKGWLAQALNAAAKEASPSRTDEKKHIEQLRSKIDNINKNLKKATDAKVRKRIESDREKVQEELASLEAKVARSTKARASAIARELPGLIEQAYLRTFSRKPTPQEQSQAERYVAESPSIADGMRDLVWALTNSKEFVVNH
jgi:hypothetical protein